MINHTLRIERRGRKNQGILGLITESGWWYQSWIPFQISPTECVMPLNRMRTGIYTVDFGLGYDLAIFDQLNAPIKKILPMKRTALEHHPRTGNPVQMTRWAPHGGFVPLGAKRQDGTPHPHAGTGFGVSTLLAFPCDEQGNLTTRMYCDTDDVYISTEILQYRYDGEHLIIEHTERVEFDQFLPGWKLNGTGLGLAIPDGEDLLSVSNAFSENPENMIAGVARWRRMKGHWYMIEFIPVATETGFMYSEPTIVRDSDGSLLFCARANLRHTIQVWRSTNGGYKWDCLFTIDNMRPLTPISINSTDDGRAYISANPYCANDLDSRGNKRYANILRERIFMWQLSEDRKRLMEPVALRDGPVEFGIPPSGSIWVIDHPESTTLRLADGKWHHIVSYRLLDGAEILDSGSITELTGSYYDEIELYDHITPRWLF